MINWQSELHHARCDLRDLRDEVVYYQQKDMEINNNCFIPPHYYNLLVKRMSKIVEKLEKIEEKVGKMENTA